MELSNYIEKNRLKTFLGSLKPGPSKRTWSVAFLIVVFLFYFSDSIFNFSSNNLESNVTSMNRYGKQLENYQSSIAEDTILINKERELVLNAIEKKIVGYLYQIPDYTYIESLESYFKYAPQLLEEIPSAVPVEKGDYTLSSKFGMRQHPISGKTKKHQGIDLAAASNKHVYATAAGIISSVVYDKNGYGTHIIVKHRFGFETLYGHLDKVLVGKGQKVGQHELIGTVGNSGASTGYHLHYEVIKNLVKIDPMKSLALKYRIVN